MRRYRRPFQLLELLIAAFILCVCIVPAMKIMTTVYLGQQEVVRENQRDHLAHLAHARVTELLYKRQLQDVLANGSEQAISFGDRDLDELLSKAVYSCKVKLSIKKSHTPKGEHNADKFLVLSTIQLKDESAAAKKKAKGHHEEGKDPLVTEYDYLIYIDAGALAEEERDGSQGQTNNGDQNGANKGGSDESEAEDDSDDFDDDDDDDYDDDYEDDDDDDDDEPLPPPRANLNKRSTTKKTTFPPQELSRKKSK